MTPLSIDGSYGEGGGQIVRTAVSLAAIGSRPVEIHSIRAGRPKPGLSAQHIAAIRAAAALCDAEVEGDTLGSIWVRFAPRSFVRCGSYEFDVAAFQVGGSAGAATLALQAVLLPLALGASPSRLRVHGGTHVPWSPPYDYVADVLLPLLRGFGFGVSAELTAWGWYPAGGGEIDVSVWPIGPERGSRPNPLLMNERGELRGVHGRAVAANLPLDVPRRLTQRARLLLRNLPIEIGEEVVSARCAGYGLFLTAEYDHVACGFSALHMRGKSPEAVAEEAASALLEHHCSSGALDPWLADQALAPLAFASGQSSFTVSRVSEHLRTNAWLIDRFELAAIGIATAEDGLGQVTVRPRL